MIARVLAVALVLVACGPSSPRGPVGNATGRGAAAERVEDIALRFRRAALAGDLALARSLTLTHEQFAELSTKPIDKTDYERERDELLASLGREGRENQSGEIVEAKVVKTEQLSPETESKVRK